MLAEPMLLGGRPLAFGAGAGVAIGGSIAAVSGVCGMGIGGVTTGGADGAGSGMGSLGPAWGTVGWTIIPEFQGVILAAFLVVE